MYILSIRKSIETSVGKRNLRGVSTYGIKWECVNMTKNELVGTVLSGYSQFHRFALIGLPRMFLNLDVASMIFFEFFSKSQVPSLRTLFGIL